jgi:hypothetical protein
MVGVEMAILREDVRKRSQRERLEKPCWWERKECE